MSRTCPNTKQLCTSFRCEGGCYWGTNAGSDQPAPTPRTDAALLADREGDQPFIDFARQLERELSAKTAEAERLREALKPKIMPSVGVAIGTRLRDFYRNRFALVNPVQHTDNERQVILAALESLLAALAATRKECEHGKGLTDYCQPCGRVNNG